MIFWMFFVVLFMRFGCDIGQSANIWIWVSSEVTTICFRGYAWSVDQLITSLLATPCWRDPTGSKQLPTVAILGFRFGLYHVVFDNTLLAWESTSVKTWENSLAAGITEYRICRRELYPQRHQQYSELRSNDIVLIEEHGVDCGIVVSGIPLPAGGGGGVTEEQFTKRLCICLTLNTWSDISFSSPNCYHSSIGCQLAHCCSMLLLIIGKSVQSTRKY